MTRFVIIAALALSLAACGDDKCPEGTEPSWEQTPENPEGFGRCVEVQP